MSTRRARIKAVASLPVRRKGQGKETERGSVENTFKAPDDPVSEERPTETAHNSPKKEHPLAAADSTLRGDSTVPQRRRIVKPSINIPSKGRRLPTLEVTSHDKANHEKAGQEQVGQSGDRSDQGAVDQPRVGQEGARQSGEAHSEAVQNVTSPERVCQDKVNEGKAESGLELGEECSFDPIIPLPGANKNRPKLKPVPKLALRRNSLQGSASEAEDAPCEPPPAAPPPPATPTPQPAPPAPRAIRPRAPRGKARARPPPAHQALTMYDLIFYNPPNNAIKREVPPEVPPSPPPPLVELAPPSPPAVEAPEAAPVPQVKLGPNGEIVIDEQSLVIETSEALRSRQRLSQLSVVWDGGSSGRGVYGRGRRCREWGRAETLRFYRALHTLGTDFSLMLPLFPGRSRRDLKVKFKKEERQNGVLVDRALMNPLQLDIAHLEEEAALVAEGEREELELARRPAVRRAGERKRQKTHKTSLALASIQTDEYMCPTDTAKKPSQTKKFKIESLATDSLARETALPDFPRSPEMDLSSPSALVPPNVEPGSLVILAGAPHQQELRAYVVQLVRGQNKLCPVELPADVIRAVASQVGVTALAPAS